jgi:hypothetical protein
MTLEALESRRLLSNPAVVDLLALFTPGASAAHGGAAMTHDLIRQVVDTANAALQRSLIPITIRLVHVEEIAYAGSGNLFQDRMRLQTPGDGFLDSVHALRNTWGADLVHLVTDNSPGSGGNAALLDNLARPDKDTLAFSVMDQTSLQPSNLTFAHEIGHNLGGGHERGNVIDPAVGPFSYSYGYRYTGAGGIVYHDIMSADPGLAIPYFANPAVSYGGAPTGAPVGSPNEADLAQTFIQTGPVVAAYRATAVADNAAPVGSIYQREPAGHTLTITVRYRDDSAVDLATIGAGDVHVRTREGFELIAEFLDVTGGTSQNEFQKFARYRVTLPANNPPLESLQVVLRASQIKDAVGNFAPPGSLATAAGDNAGWNFIESRDLGAPTSVVVSDLINDDDTDDIYKLTVPSNSTVSIALSGLIDEINVYFAKDVNGNLLYEGATEFIKSTFNPGSGDRAIGENLTAGTYYVWVYRQAVGNATPYALTVDRYDDMTPPGARLDATDMKTAGAAELNFAIDYIDERELDAVAVRFDASVEVQVQLDGGGGFSFPVFPDFATNEPFPQNAASYRTLYRLPAFNAGTGWTAADNGVYTITTRHGAPQTPGARDAAGNLIPIVTLGSFRIAIGTPDTAAPTATLSAPAVLVPGGATHDFMIEHRDNVAVDEGTIGTGDVRVTGPGGFNELASFVSLSSSPAVGSGRLATYRITAPGLAWDHADDGSYTISIEPNQVRDTNSNPLAAGAVGTLTVHVPYPGDANGDDMVNSDDFNLLATNFGRAGRGVQHGDFNFNGVVDSDDFNILATRFGTSLSARVFSRGRIVGSRGLRVADELRVDQLA